MLDGYLMYVCVFVCNQDEKSFGFEANKKKHNNKQRVKETIS